MGHQTHYLREATRKMVCTQIRQDLARGENPEHAALVELVLEEGVERDQTLMFCNAKETTEDVRGIFRLIFVNGVWTTKIRAKMPKHREAGPLRLLVKRRLSSTFGGSAQLWLISGSCTTAMTVSSRTL